MIAAKPETRTASVCNNRVICQHKCRQTVQSIDPGSLDAVRLGSPPPVPTSVDPDLHGHDCHGRHSKTSQGLPLVFFLPCKKSPFSLFAGQRVPTAGVHLTPHSIRRTRRPANRLSSRKTLQHSGHWHPSRRTQKRRKRLRQGREG